MAAATFSTLRPPDKMMRCALAAQRANSQSAFGRCAILTGARAVEEKGEDIGVAIKRSKGSWRRRETL